MIKHALLSASGAHRWLNCPPSARLESTLPNTQSGYAAEGTLAHEIAELKARHKVTGTITTKQLSTQLNKLKKYELYNPEMLQYTDVYVDYILSCSPLI